MGVRFLLKTSLLVILLVVVLVIAIAFMNFGVSDKPEDIQTRTFFEQFIIAGGPIVWFILLPMSFLGVFFVAEHFLTVRRKLLLPTDVSNKIINAANLVGCDQLQQEIGEREDFVSKAVVRSIAQGKGDWFRMRNLLFESLQEQALALVRKIEWLNLIGNVSPMVGLFGTVFGMIKLFNAIVISSGQPQPAQLAEGISVALVTTFWGLFIAIPSLALYSIFRNRIEAILSESIIEAENIMPAIRESLNRQTASQARPPQKTNHLQSS